MTTSRAETSPVTRWFSLQRRLLGGLLAGVVTSCALVLSFFWLEARHETNELLDAQLAQAAQTLLNLASRIEDEAALPAVLDMPQSVRFERDSERQSRTEREPNSARTAHDGPVDLERHPVRREIGHLGHQYQSRLRFQLWRADGRLLLRSANAPDNQPLAQTDGFSDSVDAGSDWRNYREASLDQRLRVEVSENQAGRQRLAKKVIWRLILPLALLLPLMSLWLWWGTRKSLAALNQIAGQIAARSPSQLAALTPPVAPHEIRPMLFALNQLFARVATTLETERQFTADAAHELRTPLAVLQARLQTALHAAHGNAELTAVLIPMQEGLTRAGHLIEQMLQLARLTPEAGLPAPRAVDLALLTEAVCADLGAQILDKALDFRLEAAADCAIVGQEEWLRVMLSNLVENAVRHSPQGSSLRVKVQRDDADPVVLSVTDSGPGIPAAERDKVLRRFYRLRQSDAPGSGLGLPIAARIAELHGARLTLQEGANGQGLRAEVRWPAALSPQSAKP